MGRIGARLAGSELLLLNRLAQTNAAITLSNLRLATGNKINAPRDNPAGFVQLANWESQLANVRQTMSNVTRATSIVSQSQLAIDQVRTQLNSIRSTLLEDADQSLSSSQRLANQSAIDQALDTINGLAGEPIDGRRVLDGSADFQISGRNSSQLTGIDVLQRGSPSLLAAAQPARLTYAGSDGLIQNAANITLTGAQGSYTLDVAATDSLAEVAKQINAQTSQTGVTARAEGDSLLIESATTGSDAAVSLTVNSGTFAVTGGSDGTAFGTAAQTAANVSFAGEVLEAASQALLIHDAGGATIAADANFTLSGPLGSATIDVLASENLSLADFATRINNESYQTGITASVDGTEIVFRSVEYGRDAEIELTVNSGSLATEDEFGNAASSDLGSDLVATINGRTYRGNAPATGARLVHHSDGGAITYDAEIQIVGPDGTSTITIDTASDTNDTLSTLQAAINAVQGTTGVTATIENDALVLTTDDTGADATLELNVLSGTFAVDGGAGDGTAQGSDAVTGGGVDGNRVTVADNGTFATLDFAGDFVGTFDTVEVTGGGLQFNLFSDLNRTSTLALPSLQTARLGGLSGTLADLRTGGAAAGLGTNTARGLRIVDEALARLNVIEGTVDGFASAAIDSAAALSSGLEDVLIEALDQLNGVDENEESALLEKNQILASNTVASLAILGQQRQRIADLITQIAGL